MDFKEQLREQLKRRELSENSINLYLRNLERLNNNKPLKNLTFLSKIDDVKERLKDYKENTQRVFLISIVSTLNAVKDSNKRLQKTYKTYYDMMNDLNKHLREQPTEKKSDSQEQNWLSWEEVRDKYNEIASKVPTDKKELSEKEYEALLQCVIMSLYIELPPRRNQDYGKMMVVKSVTDGMSKDVNYLDLDKKEFVFNVYKTAKKYGQQTVSIPEKLMDTIILYLKSHPIIRGKINKKTNVPFLVKYDGKPLDKINSITRVLNRVFKKNIGSSMLRHIYLSGKYDNISEEQKKDAEMMGHSVGQQKDYIKNDNLTSSPENITITVEKQKKPRKTKSIEKNI
jgi:integrase